MSSSIGKAAGGELDKAGLVFPNSGNPVEKQSIAEERDFRLSDGHPPQYVEFEERNGHREEQSRSLSRGRGKGISPTYHFHATSLLIVEQIFRNIGNQ